MKSRLLILFTFYFFVSSTGIFFSRHFCGPVTAGSVWGISLGKGKVSCCCKKKGRQHKKNCCKEESQWLKAKTDAPNHHTFLKLKPPVVDLFDIFLPVAAPLPLLSSTFHIPIPRPPPTAKQPCFIFCKTLII